MNNVVTLHPDKRWKAVIEYRAAEGIKSVEHYFEQISDLHLVIEQGSDWNLLFKCTITLNRPDEGNDQNSAAKALRRELSS